MAENKKYFTDESLATFVSEIKSFTNEAISEVSFLDINEDGALVGKANPINADTLAGQLPEYYATVEQLAELDEKISNQASAEHNHDDRYYTETEIDTKLENLTATDVGALPDTTVIPSIEGLASEQFVVDSINAIEIPEVDFTGYATETYVQQQIDNIPDVDLSKHALKTEIPTNVSELTNDSGYLVASDITNKADKEHDHNNLYYTKTDVDAKFATKSDTTHNHDNKYDAKGSASAVQDNLNVVSDTLSAHTGNSDIHVTTTNKNNWSTAYTHSQSAHARTDATNVADSTTNGNILIDGTETNVYTHPNSGVAAGTYKSVTVNAQGHITAGSNPTTLAGYGITDAETKGAANSALTAAKEYTDTVASGKSDTSHNHDSAYDAKGAASDALATAKSYTDTKTSGLASTSTVDSKISSHNTNTSAHSDIRELITNLTTRLNALANSTDEDLDQMAEIVAYIKSNKSLIDSITTSKINVSDIVDNLTTSSTSKVLSAKQGVAIKALIDALQEEVDSKADASTLTSHTGNKSNPHGVTAAQVGAYTKSEIDSTVSSLNTSISGKATKATTLSGYGITDAYTKTQVDSIADGKSDTGHSHTTANITDFATEMAKKADKSHGTHVTYDSTNKPKMDGTAAFGTSGSVARADHVHPTDTSRASKTEFDTHNSDTTKHITSTERTNWGAAYTHSQAAHAPSNAQPNQNAFSNVKVGSTTVAADTTTDTIEFVGSNVTITPDATNDKITFTVADGSTSAKGLVQLTNSTSSTSTTTAATPNSVKSAYDLANTAKTNAATAQTRADSAYSLAECKVDSLSDLGITATATELNYVDGVTSAIQTQLDNKVQNNPFHSEGTSGTLGYVAFAQLKITNSYTNRPMEFELICRGKDTPCYVSVVFQNLNSTDPALSKLLYWGSDYGVFAHKTDTSTWLLYYTKSESYDAVTVVRKQAASQNITITHPLNFITTKPTSNVINASLGGSIGFASTATKATQDGSGNVITSTYATKTELSGKANSSHGNHVPTTQTADNATFLRNDNTWQKITPANIGAAASSHGTHVSYGTSATAVGATASAGSASTVSRSDHTHSLSKSAVTTALGYTPPTKDTTYSAATTSAAGLMSASDKSKLDGIATGANKITVDSALSSSSTNPVQNKVINSALAGKLSTSGTAARATADANGNNIVNTYATKTELNNIDGYVYLDDADVNSSTEVINADTWSGHTPSTFLNLVYPVGAIYMSVNSTSPATLFGGTWERIQDRFLLAAGSSYSAGATGGEATHTLTVNEMPAHSHIFPSEYKDWSSTNTLDAWQTYILDESWGQISSEATTGKYLHTRTISEGGSQPHNNIPPYLAVYMWKRTA